MTYPPLSVLSPSEAPDMVEEHTDPKKVRDVLSRNGCEVVDVSTALAPQVVRYRVKLADGSLPAKAERLTDALSLALDRRVRYAGVNTGAVVFESSRENRETVSLRDVVDVPLRGGLAVNVGLGVDSLSFSLYLSSLPHLLVAGTTGSGKSTFLTAMVTALMMWNSPDELRFIMIDPKRVELAPFADSPHLLRDIVQDTGEAIAALRQVEAMMDERYRVFEERGVKELAGFNALNRDKPLQRVVVIVDELADLMLTSGKTVEPIIVRLAQLGRAAGVHLVLATQRPEAKTFTGLIRSNIPARIAFAVQSHHDAKIALGVTGAEKLSGMGDGLFMVPGAAEPRRFQSAFVSAEDAERVCKWWRQQMPDVVVAAPHIAPPKHAKHVVTADDPALREKLDAWKAEGSVHSSSTPEEILGDAGITSEVVDAIAELLTERIASGVLEHIQANLGGSR